MDLDVLVNAVIPVSTARITQVCTPPIFATAPGNGMLYVAKKKNGLLSQLPVVHVHKGQCFPESRIHGVLIICLGLCIYFLRDIRPLGGENYF